MPMRNAKREAANSTERIKTRSSMETLLDSMDELADSAAKRMTPEELGRARKEINESIDRVVAGGQQRRRETA
jgi:hypothetical protein